MRIDKQADIDLWIKPARPENRPEPGYEEWLQAEIEAGLAELDQGKVVTLADVKKEFGLE
jgi:hypothetical protein